MANSVDTRIVELEFDNAQFEAGVQTSLNTLRALEDGLNFSNNVKDVESLQSSLAAVNFDGASQKASGLKGILTDGLTGAINVIETIRDKIDAVGSTGKIVMAALSGGLVGLAATGGMRRALNIEQARFQIKGLGYDFEDVYDQIDGAVKDTAYGFDEAAIAASQFLASGVNIGNEMYERLKAISGVAAITNTEYADIAHIFTKIAASGRVTNQEFLELSNRGLAAADILADYFNQVVDGSMDASDAVRDSIWALTNGAKVTGQELKQAMATAKGEVIVDFDMFAEGMYHKFGEYATAANETLTGSAKNVKAVFSRMGEAYITPFNQLRTQINNALLGDPNDRLGQGAWKGILRQLETTVKSAKPLWTEVASMVGDVIYGVLRLAAETNIVETFGKTLTGIFEGLAGVLNGARNSIGDIAGAIFTGFGGVVELVKSVGSYFTPVLEALKTVSGFKLPEISISGFANVMDRFKQWATDLHLTEDAAEVLRNALETLFSGVRDAGSFMVNTLKALWEIISPIAELIGALALTGVVSVLTSLNDALVDSGVSLSEISRFGSGFLDFIRNIKDRLGEAGGLRDLPQIISDVSSSFEDLFANNPVLGTFASLISTLANGLGWLADRFIWVNDKLVENGISFDNIGKFFDIAGGHISDFLSIFANGLPDVDTFSTALETLGAGFSELFDKAGGKIGPFVEKVETFLAQFVGDKFAQASEFIANIASGFVELAPSIAGLGEGAIGGVGDLFNAVFDVLKKLFETIFTPENAHAAEQVGDSLGTVAENVGFLQKTFGEVAGGPLGEFANGVKEAFGNVPETMKAVVDAISPAMDAVGSIIGAFSRWADQISQENIFMILSGVFTGTFLLGALQAVLTIRDIMSGFGDIMGFAEEIKDSIIGTLDKFQDVLGTYQNKLRAEMLKDIAISIAILVGSIWLLSTIKVEDLVKAVGALAVTGGLLVAFAAAMTKISNMLGEGGKGSGRLAVIASSLSLFALAMVGVALAIKIFASLDPNSLTQGVLLAAGAIVALLGVAAALSAISNAWGSAVKVSVGLVIFAGALVALGMALKYWTTLDLDALANSLPAILAAIGGLVVVATVLSVTSRFAGNAAKMAASLVIFSVGLVVMATACRSFEGISSQAMINAGLAMLALISGLMALAAFTSPKMAANYIAAGLALLAMAASLRIIAGAVAALSAIPDLSGGLLAILGIIAGLSILMLSSKAVSPAGAVALVAVSGALIVLAGAVGLFSMLPFESVSSGLLSMGIALGILLAAGAIAGIPVVSAGLVTLAAAVAMLGVGVGAVGLGLMAFAAGLAMLAAMSPAACAAVVAAFEILLTGLAQVLVEVGLILVQGLLQIAMALAAGAPAFVQAMVTIGLAIIQGLMTLIPSLITLGALVILSLIQGIASVMDGIIAAGVQIIVSIINGIAQGIGAIIQAGFELVIAFINGIATAIGDESNQAAIGDALGNLLTAAASAAFNFVTEGIPNMVTGFVGAIGDAITGGGAKEANSAGRQVGQAMSAGYSDGASDMPDQTEAIISDSNARITALTGDLQGNISNLASGVTNSFGTEFGTLPTLTDGTLGDVNSLLNNTSGKMDTAGKNIGSGAANGFNSGIDSMSTYASNETSSALGAVSGKSGSAWWDGHDVGSNISSGMASGIGSLSYSVSDAARRVVSDAIAAAKSEADSHSPSRKMIILGRDMDKGLAIGMQQLIPQVEAMGKKVSSAAMTGAMGTFYMAQSVLDGLNYEPTIRPVMDLSGIQNGIQNANRFMSNNLYGAGMAARQGSGYLGSDTTTSKSTVINIALDYTAGEDANTIVNNLAMALKTRNILEA